MASHLWKKPNNRRNTAYRDLFENVSPELQKEFTGWNRQLKEFEWKHQFLTYRHSPIKCESTAKRLGNMGNEHFELGEWRKAMEMYNQALCFAENNSAYMGILYAKRGFCFTNMKIYGAGSVDIDLALARNLLPEWVAECRAINETFRERSKPFEPLMPKLSFQCDDDCPAMANVLELKIDDNNRACIVAKVDIDVGKTVLLEESFTSISNCYDKTCCATCLSEIRNFIPCSMCTDAVFCSQNCHQQNRVHKKTCGENFHRMPTPVKFVIQSIFEAILIFTSTDQLIHFVNVHIESPNAVAAAAKFKAPLDARMKNYGLFLKQNILNSMPMVTVYQSYSTLLSTPFIAKQFSTRTKQRFLMHLIGHHAMVLSCNAFGGFGTNQSRFISGTMSNFIAMIEHSCTPNVVHFAYGSKEVCITIRPIRAGEHLYYDYWPDDDDDDDNDDGVDWDQKMKSRKQTLWENWRIDCQCPKCCMRTLGRTHNPEMAADPAFFFVANYKKYFDNNQSTVERLKQKCIHFLTKFKDEAWSKQIEVITRAYSQCILDEYNRRYGPPSQI